MANIRKCVKCTSPLGTWRLEQIIGAKVRIKSNPLCSTFLDNDQVHTIGGIKFELGSGGECVTRIILTDTPYPYTWDDLEILNVKL